MATAQNNNVINFPISTDAGEDATKLQIWTALTTGDMLYEVDITGNPDALQLGGRWRIVANGITVRSETGGSTTAKGKVALLQGLLAGTRYIGLADGDGEIDATWYARQAYAVGNWTFSE